MIEFPTREQLPRLLRQRKNTKTLHDKRRALGLCINGGDKHGPVFRGGRCEPCWETKKKSS